MLVLVTGAAGQLGSATCKHLQSVGVDFRATDISARKELGYRVQVVNLLNREACYDLVDGCDAIVHFGNRPNEHAGNAQQVYGENCTMNMNVFQAAHELGVKKIIFASSVQTIVGNRRMGEAEKKPSGLAYLPADGDTPAIPGNCYSASKVAAEVLLRSFAEHRGLHSAIALRLPGMVRREWFDWLRRHTKIDNRWHGEYIDELFAWLTFEDAARLVEACLKADLPGYRCYFPAHPAPRVDGTPDELAARFWSTVPKKVPGKPLSCLIDIARITAETGWTPQDDFRAATPPVPAHNAA